MCAHTLPQQGRTALSLMLIYMSVEPCRRTHLTSAKAVDAKVSVCEQDVQRADIGGDSSGGPARGAHVGGEADADLQKDGAAPDPDICGQVRGRGPAGDPDRAGDDGPHPRRLPAQRPRREARTSTFRDSFPLLMRSVLDARHMTHICFLYCCIAHHTCTGLIYRREG